VSSTETGVIFGNIVYDGPSALDMNCVILNDIHIDIMDYINPASCTETQFRLMWSEFEWENKVNVSTNVSPPLNINPPFPPLSDLRAYLNHILKSTNMKCLTPEHALSGECGFLAANMYARSIFGEDALANICLEKQSETITGHIRIRSKTQGIALSLGDKLDALRSKGPKEGWTGLRWDRFLPEAQLAVLKLELQFRVAVICLAQKDALLTQNQMELAAAETKAKLLEKDAFNTAGETWAAQAKKDAASHLELTAAETTAKLLEKGAFITAGESRVALLEKDHAHEQLQEECHPLRNLTGKLGVRTIIETLEQHKLTNSERKCLPGRKELWILILVASRPSAINFKAAPGEKQ
ncbi:coatomer beta subunit appendage platform-domain-containing protein, partial [Blyttiomyces helicus]